MDGNKIRGDDLKRMAVERNPDHVVHGWVDYPQQVLLAGLNVDFAISASTVRVLVGAIDQDVVGCWRSGASLQIGIGDVVDLVGGLVVPIVDEIGAEIDVVVCSGRSIDD